MGNHEWCPNCEEDDYHSGQPCDPKKVMARIDREKKARDEKEGCIQAMEQALTAAGIKYELENGNAVVRWYFYR